ncbi:anti-sigma factor [Microbacterium sp. MC2]
MGDLELETPPERVWDAIAAEIGLSDAVARPSDSPASEAVAPVAAAGADAGKEAGDPPDAPPTPGRRRSRALFTLAAALVAIAGLGIGAWVITALSPPETVARAALEAFPGHPGATGTADVEVDRDGARQLVVTVDGGVVADTYREVWLIRNDAGALISLGVLEDETGSFPIPAGVDLDEYSLVDVSVEPIDGDPAHSGDSIVRGALAQI